MTTLEPLAAVLLFSALAAASAALGIVPQAISGAPTPRMIGWANALAAGLMLGVAYTLLTEGGLTVSMVACGVGTLLGLAFVRATHAAAGTGELDTEEASTGPEYPYKAILVDALHAADEGVAIGAAMAVSTPLGIAMAATLAVHNVPEAMVLNSVLTARGSALPPRAAVVVGVNVNQILLGVVTFSLIGLWPVLLPWLGGFAVGALIYRTLVELLPEAYHQAGHTSIAVVTLLAMGVVVLLAGVVE